MFRYPVDNSASFESFAVLRDDGVMHNFHRDWAKELLRYFQTWDVSQADVATVVSVDGQAHGLGFGQWVREV